MQNYKEFRPPNTSSPVGFSPSFLQLTASLCSCRPHAFTNCTSRVMVTSSPTSTPPLSNAEFQVKPKSLRLIEKEIPGFAGVAVAV